MDFFGATLQLRGVNPVAQPLMDLNKNVMVYNGGFMFIGFWVFCDWCLCVGF